MNKTEEMWYKHYKECNDIDYAQIERFDMKDQEDILRTKCLIGIIEKQGDRINTLTKDILMQRKVIESFESGEMKAGEKYES